MRRKEKEIKWNAKTQKADKATGYLERKKREIDDRGEKQISKENDKRKRR